MPTGLVHRRFQDRNEWEKCWLSQPQLPTLIRDLVQEQLSDGDELHPREHFNAAVYFLAGALEREGFVLFRNGGLPLIERRLGDMRQEILVRLGPKPIRGAYVPLALHIHISHVGLKEIRERYWPVMGHVPTSVAGGNVGLLQPEPTYDIWNVAGEPSLSVLREHLERYLLPYLDTLEDPIQFRRAIWEGRLPLLDAATATELLLYNFGRGEARNFLEEIVLNSPLARAEFDRFTQELTGVASLHVRPDQPIRNVAVIARAHRVMGRR